MKTLLMILFCFPIFAAEDDFDHGATGGESGFEQLAPRKVVLEKVFGEAGALFKKAGVDLPALQKTYVEKWEANDPDSTKMLEYQEEFGEAIKREVVKRAKTPEQLKAVAEIVALVKRLQHTGYSNMQYEAEDLKAFQKSVAAPILANKDNGKHFAVAAFFAAQDLCFLCNSGLLRKAPK